MDSATDKQRRSGMAIAGLVVGVVALLTSLMPIINNISFFFALAGAVLAIAGFVGCVRGKRSGKGLAIGAVVVNVVAIVAVLASQSMYGAAIDDAMNGPQAVAVSDDAGDKASDEGAGDKAGDKAQVLSVGSSVELENGMSVSVDSVTPGLVNYDGSSITCVRVTYTNNGKEALSFNPYDWKGENASGVRNDTAYYSEATEELNSGDLAAGGTVSGNLYFDGDLSAALYFSNAFADEPAATWQLS